jgi:uncharacterized membrane protein YhfC
MWRFLLISTINWLAFTVQMAMMLLFPIGLAIFFKRRFHVSWAVFFIAVGFYLMNLGINTPLAITWSVIFAKLLVLSFALRALTYAVSEELFRYLSFRAGRIMRNSRNTDGALMAGVGHGGTESIVFALLLTALPIFIALAAPQVYRGHAGEILNAPWWTFVLGGLERILAITGHLGFATLIVMAYRRSWLFLPLAILAHFLVDFTTFSAALLPNGHVWSDGLFTLWAIAALVLIVYVRRRGLLPRETLKPTTEVPPGS